MRTYAPPRPTHLATFGRASPDSQTLPKVRSMGAGRRCRRRAISAAHPAGLSFRGAPHPRLDLGDPSPAFALTRSTVLRGIVDVATRDARGLPAGAPRRCVFVAPKDRRIEVGDGHPPITSRAESVSGARHPHLDFCDPSSTLTHRPALPLDGSAARGAISIRRRTRVRVAESRSRPARPPTSRR